jgi:hypothetical protein
VQDFGRVAAVVEHHVWRPAFRCTLGRPAQGLFDAPLVFLFALALPGEDRDAAGGDRSGGVVLVEKILHELQRTVAPQWAELSGG